MSGSMAELVAEARTVIARLELVSHVPAVNLQPEPQTSEGDDIGGRRPPGGVDARDDRADGMRQVSHLVFRRRLERCKTPADVRAVRDAAQRALDAWRHVPSVLADSQPEYGTTEWKLYVAKSDEPARVIARRYGITTQWVNFIRADYRRRHAA